MAAMDRGDALARLGLDDGATPAQVLAAYKAQGRGLKRSILAADTDEEKAQFRRELGKLAECRDAALGEEPAPVATDSRAMALARLGLDAGATPFQVKAAYKNLSQALKSRILSTRDRETKEKLRAEMLELQATRDIGLGKEPLSAPAAAPPDARPTAVLDENEFKRRRRRIKARILESTDEDEKHALWEKLEQLRRQRSEVGVAPPTVGELEDEPPVEPESAATPKPRREREPAPRKMRKVQVLVALVLALGAGGTLTWESWGAPLWKKYGPQPRDAAAQAHADEARGKAESAREAWRKVAADGPADLPVPPGVAIADAALAGGEQRYADEQDAAAAAEFAQAETNYRDAVRERRSALVKRRDSETCDNQRARVKAVMSDLVAMRQTLEQGDEKQLALLSRTILPDFAVLDAELEDAEELRAKEEFASAAQRFEATHASATGLLERCRFLATCADLLKESPDTALRKAAAAGDAEAVRVMLALGADPNAGDPRPLDAAKTPAVRELIEAAGGTGGAHQLALDARSDAVAARQAWKASRMKENARIPDSVRQAADLSAKRGEKRFVDGETTLKANAASAALAFDQARSHYVAAKAKWNDALAKVLRELQEDRDTTRPQAEAARAAAYKERKRFTDFSMSEEGLKIVLEKGLSTGDPGAAHLDRADRDLAAGKFGPARRAYLAASEAYAGWLAKANK
ncbi:MAG: hypothetical protein ACYTGN_17955 [Planctomycetota bacterium]|jgi:hypothetical protein